MLRFFADEAPSVGLHLDLKLTKRERDVVAAVQRFGLAERTFVSSTYVNTARAIADVEANVRTGFTIPRRVFRISDQGRTAPLARGALWALRRFTPWLVRPALALTRVVCSKM